MKNRTLVFWLAVLLLFSGAMTIMYASGRIGPFRRDVQGSSRVKPEELNLSVSTTGPAEAPTLEIDAFQMVDQLGRKFHSDQLRGKIWVGSIFFANCPSTCRMQNAEVAKLQAEYAEKGVEFVSITCDPENDTVVKLAEYARMFNANPEKWHFLTGDYAEAERIGNTMFGITVQPETHSDRLVLINRAGKVHSTHRSMLFEDLKNVRKELDKLLAEDVGSQVATSQQGVAPGDDSDHTGGGDG